MGNRVVHGGNKYSKSVEITDRVLMEIEEISDLAPLHNPAALKGIYAFKKNIPNAKLVACFDTAFHQTMKEKHIFIQYLMNGMLSMMLESMVFMD